MQATHITTSPSDPPCLIAALHYAEVLGWHVFPVKANKTPLNSNGHNGATRDAALIRRWWCMWPFAGVGVRTGPESNVVVVDIDKKSGGEVTWETILQNHGPLPDTAHSITGGGGSHYLFRNAEGVRNTAGHLGPGIDTRGDGGYFVAPPSRHESGQSYTWEASSDPTEGMALAELPDWLNPLKATPIVKTLAGTGDALIHAVKPLASAPTREGGRNQAAAANVGTYLGQGDPLVTALRRLREWNRTNLPPLNDTELVTTTASVARTHVRKNPGAIVFYDGHSGQVIENNESLASVMRTLRAADAEPSAPSPLNYTPAPIAIEVATPAEPEPVEQKPAGFPPALLEPPGYVGEITKWINDTAYKPQPILALGNTLALVGAILGRKVRTPRNLRTNLYVLGVGETGCGKEHSRQRVKKIAEAAGLKGLLGGEDISSDTAIFGAVAASKSILFQWDEIGHLITNNSSRNAATHQKAIAPLLTKLFTSAGTTIFGKEYANRQIARVDIDQPCCCIYGTTVPSRLYDGLSPSEISDGFLGRMLVFQSNDPDPLERDCPDAGVPESIRIMASEWFKRIVPRPADMGDIEAAFTQPTAIVPFEPAAVAVMNAFRAKCREYKAEHRAAGHGFDALWARAGEHADKVALILACGTDFASPVIRADVADYAVKLVEYLTNSLIGTVGDSVAGSDFERDLLYVMKHIQKSGRHGVGHSALIGRTRRLNPRQRTDILNQLIQTGMILAEDKAGKAGPSGKMYRTNPENARKSLPNKTLWKK